MRARLGQLLAVILVLVIGLGLMVCVFSGCKKKAVDEQGQDLTQPVGPPTGRVPILEKSQSGGK